MSWREAHDVRQRTGNDGLFDALEAQIPGNVRLIGTPIRWIDAGGAWHGGVSLGLVVTSDCVAIAQPKSFGRVKVVFRAPILHFLRGGAGPYSGSGPLWEVYQKLSEGGSVSFLFERRGDAEAVAEYINSGVAFARSQ